MANTNFTNTISTTGYVSNVKFHGKNVYFSIGMGVRQQDGSYKNGFLNCKSTIDRITVVKGQKSTVTGFMTFQFWQKDGKEQQAPVVFVQSVEVLEQPRQQNGQNQATQQPQYQQQNVQEQPAQQPQQEVASNNQNQETQQYDTPVNNTDNIIDVNEDEIPF